MLACFDNPTAVDDQNGVGVGDGSQPVCDHDDRASDSQPADSLLNSDFGFRIGKSRHLVEQKDRGISKQRAGDGNALALSQLEAAPAIGENRVVTVRQRLNKGVGLRVLRRSYNSGVIGILAPDADVCRHGIA